MLRPIECEAVMIGALLVPGSMNNATDLAPPSAIWASLINLG